MTVAVIAVGAVVWLFLFLLVVGLARAAALADLSIERALAAERGRRVLAAERGTRVRRAA
jgi:hypothetical protein